MKKSYKKMIIFQFIILIIFSINSFIKNILTEYNGVIILLIMLLLFKKIFGLEKDHNRYTKDIIYEIIIFVMIFFIVYYILGLKIGYARIENYYSYYGISRFIIPIVLNIIIKEIIRYNMLKKTEGNKKLEIMTYIIFVFLEVTTAIYYSNLTNGNDVFTFMGLVLIPGLVNNILNTYISKRVGYKPVIIYELIMKLYLYLIPIIPNPNQYLASIINIVMPLILFGKISNLFDKEEDRFEYSRDRKESAIYLIIPVLITIVIVYFTSGYFKYHAIAIASGSMEPKLKKGDVVIIERRKKDLKEGQIIAYKYNEVIIIHRIEQILNSSEEKYYYTKGDNNKNRDDYVITEEMIIGVVRTKIPYIGNPTVWLSEM